MKRNAHKSKTCLLLCCLGLLIGLLGCETADAPTPLNPIRTRTSQPEPTRTATATDPSPTPSNTPQPATATTLPTNTDLPSPTATLTPSQTPRVLPPLVVDAHGVLLALIPAGSFLMGSAEFLTEDAEPVHPVMLADFYIDQYEITNARYAECVDAGVCDAPTKTKSETRPNYYGNVEYADYPVVFVNWYAAQTYCQWRGGRLPTEAEWEKAARGGFLDEMYLYPWGNDMPLCKTGARADDLAACGGRDTEPVGSYPPNGYELYDMAGNVYEWVQSLHHDYPYDPADGRENPQANGNRVLRGGSWYTDGYDLSVAYRSFNVPDISYSDTGFRCVHEVVSLDAAILSEVLTPITLTPEAATPPTATPTPAQEVPMALIPAGPFEMGGDVDATVAECLTYRSAHDCAPEWFEDQAPLHTVLLDDFYIDQYEVTNTRYAACVQAEVCNSPSDFNADIDYLDAAYAHYPVTNVTWLAAQAYCQWRGGRLPTEAEWEKAARGGLAGALYPWGNTFDGNLVNYCDVNCQLAWQDKRFNDGYSGIAPVGSYPPNGYGIYDMAGNVFEWVADWYAADYYANSPERNPQGPEQGEQRVVRSSYWNSHPFELWLAHRDAIDPSVYTSVTLGFRCARSAAAP